MQTLTGQHFAGERALYHSEELNLENCVFDEGESALKESSHLTLTDCSFICKYVNWHNRHVTFIRPRFSVACRAPLWYDEDITMRDGVSESPKILREVNGLNLVNMVFNEAEETLWRCRNVRASGLKVRGGTYLFMNSENLSLKDIDIQNKYSFQYCRNVTIENALIDSKDLFWECENVVVRNSRVTSEYLAWYARNITFENCHLGGTQPLCYCKGLKLVNCIFESDADLAFENSEVEATIQGKITSVKNPVTGSIEADSIGDIILDENIREPHDCKIVTRA